RPVNVGPYVLQASPTEGSGETFENDSDSDRCTVLRRTFLGGANDAQQYRAAIANCRNGIRRFRNDSGHTTGRSGYLRRRFPDAGLHTRSLSTAILAGD